ncbi:hypothetical protein [Breoghania sp. JC706]|uniref:3-phosphoshikimate 1-carboxyvinyltransferase n=1 Tax=Breoghania sp. JC706 TaxID=3117732 RepID=UPI00300B4B6C
MSRDLCLFPGRKPSGADVSALLPGDKSVSQRVLIAAALCARPVSILGLNEGATVSVLVDALNLLGVRCEKKNGRWTVSGTLAPGGGAPRADPSGEAQHAAEPPPLLHFGGSSAAARMMCGILAGVGRAAIIDGNSSLRARPMDWVVTPLREMGARIDYLDKPGHLPLRLHPARLHPGTVTMEVASAQAKSAVLFAAAAARVKLRVLTRGTSRDHTERILRAGGTPLSCIDDVIEMEGVELSLPDTVEIPRDPSAAAYVAAFHLMAARSGTLHLDGLCLNPTRLGFYDVLRSCGAEVVTGDVTVRAGEPTGSLEIAAGDALKPFHIDNDRIVQGMIDEIPLAFALATRIPGTSSIENAAELVFKETDRLETTRAMLSGFGARIERIGHGLRCTGGVPLHPGRVDGYGDHRIAMSAAVLAATLDAPSRITEGDCFAESFLRFGEVMAVLGTGVVRETAAVAELSNG